jgi:copper homeostasis protein
MAQLEIACFNLESALVAQQNGADRVELCSGIKVGGTTPNIEIVKQARAVLEIDLYVMIRPRGGDFVYTDAEIEHMESDIENLKEHDVDGFVFGILNRDASINIVQNTKLVEMAKPLPCTFHRAFDEVSNVGQALEDVIACGFQTILTSGQKPNVVEGAETLSALVEKADSRIKIMPGGGLRLSNIESIRQKTKASFYHSSAITDGSEIAVGTEILALKSYLQ